MHPLPISAGGKGVEHPTKFSKKGGGVGGLTGSQFLESGLWERGVTFSVGCSFYIKSKLKSEIFNNKKSLYRKIFFCHN